jgi:hypothetical protein
MRKLISPLLFALIASIGITSCQKKRQLKEELEDAGIQLSSLLEYEAEYAITYSFQFLEPDLHAPNEVPMVAWPVNVDRTFSLPPNSDVRLISGEVPENWKEIFADRNEKDEWLMLALYREAEKKHDSIVGLMGMLDSKRGPYHIKGIRGITLSGEQFAVIGSHHEGDRLGPTGGASFWDCFGSCTYACRVGWLADGTPFCDECGKWDPNDPCRLEKVEDGGE